MKQDTYEERLSALQHRLLLVQQAYARQKRKAIIVLEGWDAAGKGGIIRRIAWALDPRALKVWQVAAPSDQEAGSHWMRRFWKRVPDAGELAIFDRSWYGRVLVERVEGYATRDEWNRAYEEITGWERSLCAEEYRLVKIFLDITPQEQLDRFRARFETPDKQWKLTEDDLRNRTRWADYETAYAQMIARTSTDFAPWVRIDANAKKKARIAALSHIVERLGEGVDLTPPEPPDAIKQFFKKNT